jgi:hypothetical protein
MAKKHMNKFNFTILLFRIPPSQLPSQLFNQKTVGGVGGRGEGGGGCRTFLPFTVTTHRKGCLKRQRFQPVETKHTQRGNLIRFENQNRRITARIESQEVRTSAPPELQLIAQRNTGYSNSNIGIRTEPKRNSAFSTLKRNTEEVLFVLNLKTQRNRAKSLSIKIATSSLPR